MPKMAELTGKKFGRLIVLSMSTKRATWNCLCECGNEKVIPGYSLLKGNTKSCGCFKKEVNRSRLTRHGQARAGMKTSEFNIWNEMIQRCTNPKVRNYNDYGGRGVTVCERWSHSFECFFEDMGVKPSPDHSLDRIKVDGDYSPGNCRWSTRFEQAQNKRRYKSNKSGATGVRWDKRDSKWIARINANGKRIHLGSFDNYEEATEVRKKAETEYWHKQPS